MISTTFVEIYQDDVIDLLQLKSLVQRKKVKGEKILLKQEKEACKLKIYEEKGKTKLKGVLSERWDTATEILSQI